MKQISNSPLDAATCYALPCPFCGSPAVLDYDDEDRKLAIKPFYKCSDSEKCRVFGPDGATEAEALARWNQRTSCDFCREIPLTPTEREHMDSILHNDKAMASADTQTPKQDGTP